MNILGNYREAFQYVYKYKCYILEMSKVYTIVRIGLYSIAEWDFEKSLFSGSFYF